MSPGEVWLADRGEEVHRLVYVLSDPRFHRLAERAVVAPVLVEAPAVRMPWHVPLPGGGTVAVNQLGTVPVERLLERAEWAGEAALRRARRAVQAIMAVPQSRT